MAPHTKTIVNISGLPKANVLAALFNEAAIEEPVGWMLAMEGPQNGMSLPEAQWHLDGYGDAPTNDKGITYPRTEFRSLYGRILGLDLSGDSFDPFTYDRLNGAGKAQDIITRLRNGAIALREEW